MPCLAVIDFETTGATRAQCARATEVAICLLEGSRIVDLYASLMNAGVHIPSFIVQLTGITNAMVAAHLLARMQHDLEKRHNRPAADAALLMALQRTAKHQIGNFLRAAAQPSAGPLTTAR